MELVISSLLLSHYNKGQYGAGNKEPTVITLQQGPIWSW